MRKLMRAAGIAATRMAATMLFTSVAMAQRQPPLPTPVAPVGTAPTVGVEQGYWNSENVRIGWNTPSGATSLTISREISGQPWADIATVTGAGYQEYTDVGAAKLVACGETIKYRVTANYGPVRRPGDPPLALEPGATRRAPGVSAPVTWTRGVPPPVAQLNANSPGPGQVNLNWVNVSGGHVHVFRDVDTRITSTPVTGNGVGESNVPRRRPANVENMHTYHVVAACEVTGRGWVWDPKVYLHPMVNVVVQEPQP